MRRRRLIPGWLVAAAVMAVTAGFLLSMPRDALTRYAWLLFPGVFVVALIGRAAEGAMRQRRRRRFRDGHGPR